MILNLAQLLLSLFLSCLGLKKAGIINYVKTYNSKDIKLSLVFCLIIVLVLFRRGIVQTVILSAAICFLIIMLFGITICKISFRLGLNCVRLSWVLFVLMISIPLLNMFFTQNIFGVYLYLVLMATLYMLINKSCRENKLSIIIILLLIALALVIVWQNPGIIFNRFVIGIIFSIEMIVFFYVGGLSMRLRFLFRKTVTLLMFILYGIINYQIFKVFI